MKIGIIGAGRVGTSFGKIICEHNLLSGFYSDVYPDFEYPVFDSAKELCENSDIVFITVSDDKITDVFNQIKDFCDGKILCHMSGAMKSSDAFPGFENSVSLHPMMAVATENSQKELKKAQFTVEGAKADEVAEILDFLNIRRIDSREKTRYHASCVFASNLMQAVMEISVKELVKCGFSESEALNALEKLTKTNIENIFKKGIPQSLTGPVDRHDTETVKKHLSVLEGGCKEVYKLLSKELTYIAEEKYNKDYTNMRKELN